MRWPLLIMTSVPIGISGGIAGLALLNLGGAHLDKLGLYPISQPFDMITMLGFLVLIGTADALVCETVSATMAGVDRDPIAQGARDRVDH